MRALWFAFLNRYYAGDLIREGEMGREGSLWQYER
jgi:hypothetical protein